jgi:alcohol dehydrogenase
VGTLAEYIVMPSASVAVVPMSMDMSEAGGLSGAAQTALDMVTPLKLKEGHRVLVNGSSGGVGVMVLQLAKINGAYVVATCSAASADLVKRLGADEVSVDWYLVSSKQADSVL